MDSASGKEHRGFGLRFGVAVASSAIGVALIVVGLRAGTQSREQKQPPQTKAPAQEAQKKSPRRWNIALGNMVVLAQDMGFAVKAQENAVDPAKIAARIELQLQRLRELYRLESEKNPSLVGGMTLRLDIDPAGRVAHVKETASRIADAEFKKSVLAEVGNWSFDNVVAGSVTVDCPLLFVREGMEITTLSQWEKSLASLGEKTTPGKTAAESIRQVGGAAAKALETKSGAGPKNAAVQSIQLKPAATHQLKYATSLRREPNFSSAPLTKFSAGTKLTLIAPHGQWLEVRAGDGAPSGFIRKEFTVPLD